MNTLWLILGVIVTYVLFYFLYGKHIEKKIVRADANQPTPAHRLSDGVDYVPSKKFVVFGHHFASIAGASPIIGPVIAMVWGWVPALLWVLLGNIFIGAIHDYLSLSASLRHDGKSIQWIASKLIKKRTGFVFAWFILFVLILVVAAFSAVVGKTFEARPEVATASLLLIVIAVLLGFLIYRVKLNFVVSTLIGIVLMCGAIWISLKWGIHLNYQMWLAIFFVYIIVAASLPVTVLLQPRDYLNSWLLYAGLVFGVVALILTRKAIELPAFTMFSAPAIGGKPSPFWPTIPLVVACGSLSGFHALVASGTTSKQLNKETDALFVGFGGMLTEGALSAIVILMVGAFFYPAFGDKVAHLRESIPAFVSGYGAAVKNLGKEIVVFSECFGEGVSRAIGVSRSVVTTLAALWVAAFALTTLDTTNRLARYVVTELAEPLKEKKKGLFKFLTNPWVAAFLPAFLGVLLAWTGSFNIIWPAFGGANQMLASVALVTVAAWVMKQTKGKGLIALIPAFLLWITVTAALVWFFGVIIWPELITFTLTGVLLALIVVVMLVLNIILMVDFIDVVLIKKKHLASLE